MESVRVNRIFPWSDLGFFRFFFPNRTFDYQLNCTNSDDDIDLSWMLNMDPVRHVQNKLLVAHWFINAVVNLCALGLNLCLMYLIHDRSGQMSKMRPLLNYSCAIDIMISFTCLVSGPFLHVSQGHFTTIWNGMMPTDSHAFVRMGISMAWSLIIATWGFLPLQFVYRFDVIKNSNNRRHKKWKYYVYFFSGFLAILPATILAFEINFRIEPKYAWSAVQVLQQYGLDINMKWIAGGYSTDLKVRAYAHYYTATLLFGYLVVVYTEFMRHYYVNRVLPTVNYASRRMHQDMNRVFFLMAVCPLFTSVLPSIFINRAINSCYVCPYTLLILSVSVTAGPLINAIVAITFIRPYRATFLNWMGINDYAKIYLRTCPMQQRLDMFERQFNLYTAQLNRQFNGQNGQTTGQGYVCQSVQRGRGYNEARCGQSSVYYFVQHDARCIAQQNAMIIAQWNARREAQLEAIRLAERDAQVNERLNAERSEENEQSVESVEQTEPNVESKVEENAERTEQSVQTDGQQSSSQTTQQTSQQSRKKCKKRSKYQKSQYFVQYRRSLGTQVSEDSM